MHPVLLRHLLFRDRQTALHEKIRRYSEPRTREQIEAYQVERFNLTWAECLERVPFYQRWAREHHLPRAIAHPSDLAAFPPLTKRIMIENEDEIFQGGKITQSRITGGSTGEPMRFPVSEEIDTPLLYSNQYLGRSWWGLQPFDPHVALWGHAHRFGTGWRWRVATAKRRLADQLLNITRLNAYDLSDKALARYAIEVSKADPIFIFGFTSAVFRLARYMKSRGIAFTGRRLRGVVLSAESASDADVGTIAATFGAPVLIEYGAAEMGAVAYSRGATRNIELFWDSFIALVDDDGALTLTATQPLLFPLIGYRIGDVVDATVVRNGTALNFASIKGRAQDVVKLRERGGRTLELSAILPVHILKSHDGINALQFAQEDKRLRIFVEGEGSLDTHELEAYFARELRKDHPEFDPDSAVIEVVGRAQLTIAGKQRLFRDLS